MKCKKILVIMLILIFIIVFSICVYLLLKDLQELNKSNESTEDLIEESVEINEETQEKKIDWDWIVNTFLYNFYKDTFLYSTGVK